MNLTCHLQNQIPPESGRIVGAKPKQEHAMNRRQPHSERGGQRALLRRNIRDIVVTNLSL